MRGQFPETVVVGMLQNTDCPSYHAMRLTCKDWWIVARDTQQTVLHQVLLKEFSFVFASPVHSEHWREVLATASTEQLKVLFMNLMGKTSTNVEVARSWKEEKEGEEHGDEEIVGSYRAEILTLRYSCQATQITFPDIVEFARKVSRDHSWYKCLDFYQESLFRVIFKKPDVHTHRTRDEGNYRTFGGHSQFSSGLNYLIIYTEMPDHILDRVATANVTCCLGLATNPRLCKRRMFCQPLDFAEKYPFAKVYADRPEVTNYATEFDKLPYDMKRELRGEAKDLVTASYKALYEFHDKSAQNESFWEKIQRENSDLFEELLDYYARGKESEEFESLRKSATMLVEFSLGIHEKSLEARERAVRSWWATNYKAYSDSKLCQIGACNATDTHG